MPCQRGAVSSFPLGSDKLGANGADWRLQYALLAPLLALLVATFAQNKVEGLAQFKLYNFMLNLPALIYFLPNSFLHALAVIPTYWTFRSVEALHGGGDFWFFFGGGTLVYGGALVGLVWLFEKRVF